MERVDNKLPDGPSDRPFVRFASPEVVLSESAKVNLQLSSDIPKKDLSLVIDVYNLDNPVHPAGHVGWWRFSLESLGDRVEATIEFDLGADTYINLAGAALKDSWINEKTVDYKSLVFNAVLRSNVTNAIAYLDKIPVLKDAEAVAQLRSSFNRNWNEPPLAYLSYVFPKSSTVRLVARNVFNRDAVGNLCLDIYRMLRQNNVAVELYAENTEFALNDIVRRVDLLYEDLFSQDQIFYFFSTYDPNIPQIAKLDCDRKIVYFHGITDPKKLQTFDPELSVVCAKGKQQIDWLPLFDVVATNSTANSNYLSQDLQIQNAEILNQEARLKRTRRQRLDANESIEKAEAFETNKRTKGSQQEGQIVSLQPIQVIPPKLISVEAAQRAIAIHRQISSEPKLLYVGRIKSHKKIEDILELFAEYLKLDNSAECWIVGGGSDKAYWDYLMWVEKQKLQLPPGKVRWLGNVDDDRLHELYCTASVYVSMSEDEGFCLPVLEAMLHGLPVFVYGLPAIREFIQDSGLYFNDKDFVHLAETLQAVLSNPQRCQEISDRQRHYAVPLVERMDGREFLSLFQPSFT